jgi:hypothetical protein
MTAPPAFTQQTFDVLTAESQQLREELAQLRTKYDLARGAMLVMAEIVIAARDLPIDSIPAHERAIALRVARRAADLYGRGDGR